MPITTGAEPGVADLLDASTAIALVVENHDFRLAGS